jgi:NagD protein
VSGFIATGLAHIAGQTYEVVGKPSLLAASTAAARLGVPPERMLVVGDDLSLEVAMARRVGAVGVLITTGVSSRADADAAAEGQRPHLVVDSLAELATLMLASAAA